MGETTIISGPSAVASSLENRLCSSTRTVALRDFYPGWAKAKFSGKGGKPLFLRVEDASMFPVFFDDHIRPVDPTIVDVIDVREFPRRVPMAQAYNVHLVKASPLRSIADICYFSDELARCEREKIAQLARRRRVARMLHDVAAIRGIMRILSGEEDQWGISQLIRAETGLQRTESSMKY